MIHLPSLTQLDRATRRRIWLCTGPTDMRRGFDRLAEQAQQVTRQHPQSGHLFVFRSRRGDRLKAMYWDKDGYVVLLNRPGHRLATPTTPGISLLLNNYCNGSGSIQSRPPSADAVGAS